MELSVIIVSYRVKSDLLACLESLAVNSRGVEHEVIVVDNGSGDGTAEAVREKYPEAKLIVNPGNPGFAAANNQGYAAARGEYILLLNPDTVVKPGAVGTVLDFMKTEPQAGLAACRLLNRDGSLQMSVRRLPTVGENLLRALRLHILFYPENHTGTYYRERPFRIGYPSGAFMMVRRSALKGGPLLNPDYFMYAEEKDLAVRIAENGFGCYFVPAAEIIHLGGASTGQQALEMFLELQKSQVRYYKTHHGPVQAWFLNASWWLVLFSNYLSGLPLMLAGKGKERHRLFKAAVTEYPQYMREIKI